MHKTQYSYQFDLNISLKFILKLLLQDTLIVQRPYLRTIFHIHLVYGILNRRPQEFLFLNIYEWADQYTISQASGWCTLFIVQ